MDIYIKTDISEPMDIVLLKGKVPHMDREHGDDEPYKHHRWGKCGSEY